MASEGKEAINIAPGWHLCDDDFYHYFESRTSLCGSVTLETLPLAFEQDDPSDPQPEDCAACRSKLAARATTPTTHENGGGDE